MFYPKGEIFSFSHFIALSHLAHCAFSAIELLCKFKQIPWMEAEVKKERQINYLQLQTMPIHNILLSSINLLCVVAMRSLRKASIKAEEKVFIIQVHQVHRILLTRLDLTLSTCCVLNQLCLMIPEMLSTNRFSSPCSRNLHSRVSSRLPNGKFFFDSYGVFINRMLIARWLQTCNWATFTSLRR